MFWLQLGENDLLNDNDGQTVVRVCGKVEHPRYQSSNQDFDFSILRLCDPVTVSKVGLISTYDFLELKKKLRKFNDFPCPDTYVTYFIPTKLN